MTPISPKLKNTSLTLSSLVITTCLTMPITAIADTTTSVDAIMEQMKSFKPPAPKPVSTPTVAETPVETKKEKPIDPAPVAIEPVIEPVKVETKPAPVKEEPIPNSVYVAPPQLSVASEEPPKIEQKTTKTRPATRKKRKEKKKTARKTRTTRTTRTTKPTKIITRTTTRTTTRKNSAVDYKGFDERYMSLIHDILNDKKPAKKATTTTTIDVNTLNNLFSGTGGWIYLGKHNSGHWISGKTLKVGHQLPQVGQQYTVKSPLLNLRKTRPIKGGLGKLIQVLRVGDQVHIKQLHRSVKNNYWANIIRP